MKKNPADSILAWLLKEAYTRVGGDRSKLRSGHADIAMVQSLARRSPLAAPRNTSVQQRNDHMHDGRLPKLGASSGFLRFEISNPIRLF